MAITPITKEAFAVLAMCEETKKPFGITIDPKGQTLKFVWAFKIDKEKAHREHFDSQKVLHTLLPTWLPLGRIASLCFAQRYLREWRRTVLSTAAGG